MRVLLSLGLVLGLASALEARLRVNQKDGLSFKVIALHQDNNEGIAVGDINKDGHMDVSAGEFWYAGPSFKEQKPVRKLGAFGDDYMENNGEHLYDVNGDGWLDVVSGSFKPSEVHWYENPGKEGLAAGEMWTQHLLHDTEISRNEINFFRDFDGDGVPEWIAGSYNDKNPMLVWKFQGLGTSGPWSMTRHTIGEEGLTSNGHGLGFGDVNGDGHEDVLFKHGWYERPAAGAFDQAWKYHPDWTHPHASCPMIVTDLNGDGRNDVIWADGHNYGLYWEEQRQPDPDGTTNWYQHTIDKHFSQAHALAWVDLDDDGAMELLAGKRVRAHSGRDPGGDDSPTLQYYKWNAEEGYFVKYPITMQKVGIGLQIRAVDLNGDGRLDLALAGKSGTHVLLNQGPKKVAKKPAKKPAKK